MDRAANSYLAVIATMSIAIYFVLLFIGVQINKLVAALKAKAQAPHE
jgi:hypothetical protein